MYKTKIISLLFNKIYFNKKKIRLWLKNHNYITKKKIIKKPNFYHIKIANKSKQNKNFRTISFGKNILAIIQIIKKKN
jgi:hypothetical protein